MKEIKYRIWTGKKMLYEGDSELDHYAMTFDGKIVCGADTDLVYAEFDWMLMQYIGLKDINGKDIYEGDIIRHLSWVNSFDNQTDAWGESEVIDNLQDFFENKGYSEQELGESYDSEHLEVTGNVYENPELLNK